MTRKLHVKTTTRILLTLIGLFCLAGTTSAAVIYVENFNGSAASPLNGTTPNSSPGGETWLASADWSETGVTSTPGNDRNAFLPFTPASGKLYRLSATLNPDIAGSSNWIGLGFSGGASTGTVFWQAPNNLSPWVLMRMDDTASDVVRTFAGPGVGSSQSFDFTPDKIGPVNFEVHLDTTQANWGASWYADGALLRTHTYGSNPTITHVGFGADTVVTGSVSSFRLDQGFGGVPEPTTVMFVLVGAATLSASRRLRGEIMNFRK